MKTTSLLSVCVVLLLAGCSTAYRTGQTPDDVYFSPARPEAEYVRVQRTETRRVRYYEEDSEDRFLRMRIRHRNQWNDLDDWYTFERWSLGYNQSFAPTLNPFVSWNYFYNPYFFPVSFAQAPVKNIYTRPRLYNLGSYQQTPVNLKTIQQSSSAGSHYIPFGTQRSSHSGNRGNALREAFGSGSPGGVSGGSPVSSPVNNNAASSSSGSSAPVRRF
ncbi:MAG: hypothetical protein ACKO41_00200 [Sphingomonadales bacterium]